MRERIDYLDGLRAVAVLSVVLIHYGGFGLRALGAVGNSIVDHGKYGVTIFFVLSAYSLCLSISGRSPDWTNFYIRRFFRIAPLYWIVCLVMVFAGRGDLTSLVSHLTFANIIDLPHVNDLVWVEWSIPVEVSFYILFPFFYFCARRAPIVLLVIASCLAIPELRNAGYLALLPFSSTLYENRAYTLPFHLSAFLAGMLAFFWLPRLAPPPLLSIAAITSLVALLGAAGESGSSQSAVVALTVLLIALCQKSGLARAALGCVPIAFIGRISFSIYLVHFYIGIQLVEPFTSLAVTLLVSTAAYYLIERPAQEVGRQLIAVRDAAAAIGGRR